MPEFVPILDNKADKSKGEIFSTVWYCSSAQVFGAQHYEIARMILIAENPNIRYVRYLPTSLYLTLDC